MEQNSIAAARTNPPITLLLSGGGFRATLFHLGVVRYLHIAGYLNRVTKIFSVSGGSVTAAHLVLNWERYTADHQSFENVAQELTQFATSDLRGKIVRRRLCFALGLPVMLVAALVWLVAPWLAIGGFQPNGEPLGWFERILLGAVWIAILILSFYQNSFFRTRWRYPTSMLVEYFSDFFTAPISALPTNKGDSSGSVRSRPATLGDLTSRTNSRPELSLLATNFSLGTPCSFGSSGLRLIDLEAKVATIPTTEFDIGRAVAASAAFPALFSPVEIDARMVGRTSFEALQRESLVLTDGGVYDNLGIGPMKLFSGTDHGVIVLSDAQAAFEPGLRQTYSRFFERQIRVLDVLMNRITLMSEEQLSTKPIRVPIGRITTHRAEDAFVTPEQQSLLARTRTDFDDFRRESALLQFHGFCVAREVFSDPTNTEALDPTNTEALGNLDRVLPPHPPIFDQLQLGGLTIGGDNDPTVRRWCLFSRKDYVSCAMIAFGGCWIFGAIAVVPPGWLCFLAIVGFYTITFFVTRRT